MPAGYYRYPTIHEETIVFVCEDDLWTVSAAGGVARRLTSGLAEASYPALSPDGRTLAFSGREEGQPDIYSMPAAGGPVRRLTYMGAGLCLPVGWTAGGEILFVSNSGQPFRSLVFPYRLELNGGKPVPLNIGPASALSYGPGKSLVIGRNTGDPARWKRYRGGTAGQIWVDPAGDGDFRPLVDLAGNLAAPMWLGERIFFLSDHEGIGNLYSCTPLGEDVRRHSDHDEFYARNASSDGRRIVYHAGASLYLFDPAEQAPRSIPVTFHSPQTQRNRKFVNAAKYLDSWNLHPEGHLLAITTRGKAFTFGNWEGAVVQYGQVDGSRYRLLDWLNDGRRLVAVTDAEGEEAFVILPGSDGTTGTEGTEPELLAGLDIGRPVELAVNPKKDQVLFSNHRFELCLLDLQTRELTVIDRGSTERIAGLAWSPDGEWAAYGLTISTQRTALRLWRAETGEIIPLTDPVLHDVAPAFDPGGKYLYFLSYRHFDPVYDDLHFDLNFPRGVRPYLITLQADQASPFIPVAQPPQKQERVLGKDADDEEGDHKDAQEKDEPIRIDLDGIMDRIVPFPIATGKYGGVLGLKENRVLYTRFPIRSALADTFDERPSYGTLLVYDFEKHEEKEIASRVKDFKLSRNSKTMILQTGKRLRVLAAGEEPSDEAKDKPGRESGWIDLHRVKVSVHPGAEWQQMYAEAWRLQRDHFWTPDMAEVDWLAIYERYRPLVEKVASRSEFSDLMWEMQGELGTSHSYEIGGDYRPQPRYDQGFLGAEFDLGSDNDGWRISRIVLGDPWDEKADSPLRRPGINVKEGDRLLAVNGRRLGAALSPEQVLVNLAGQEVTLTVADGNEEKTRTVTVKTLAQEMPLFYREWVNRNRRQVHKATEGKVGYLHIPDMMAPGYAEFHRGYLAEVERQGLIVDVRFNRGGHVSQLLLEKLARRRIGYDTTRWSREPFPYPSESVLGPIVAVTNEFAGSDGDIFSHGFKLMRLGPLIGTRTWGGVIGIWPRHALVDGTMTTQPEFSFWFDDVGWGVENYGTDPDIEVENRPQDYMNGVDAQLERAIQEALTLLSADPPKLPSFDQRPSRALPKLPARKNES